MITNISVVPYEFFPYMPQESLLWCDAMMYITNVKYQQAIDARRLCATNSMMFVDSTNMALGRNFSWYEERFGFCVLIVSARDPTSVLAAAFKWKRKNPYSKMRLMFRLLGERKEEDIDHLMLAYRSEVDFIAVPASICWTRSLIPFDPAIEFPMSHARTWALRRYSWFRQMSPYLRDDVPIHLYELHDPYELALYRGAFPVVVSVQTALHYILAKGGVIYDVRGVPNDAVLQPVQYVQVLCDPVPSGSGTLAQMFCRNTEIVSHILQS